MDPRFYGTNSQKKLFGIYLKRHRDGMLKKTRVKRAKVRNFASVKEKLVTYLNLRAENYQRDKCGLSWHSIRGKFLKWQELDPDVLN